LVIFDHELDKGEIREDFLISVLEECAESKPCLVRGTLSDGQRDAGQLDIILCRPHSQLRKLGQKCFVAKSDSLCVIEVKGNCTGRDLERAEAKAKKIQKLKGDHGPLYGGVCYKSALDEKTIMKRFGYSFDKTTATYLDPATNTLRVPPTKRKVIRRGVSTGLPTTATHRNHVWTWDFIADATVRGGALRLLMILDEHTRECPVLRVDRALRAQDVLAWLQKAIEQQGAPEYLRSDNGSEFIAKIVQQWLAQNHIKTIYIEPGSPWQNGFVESFYGRFRDECLNREQLWTLTEARVVIGDYRCKYNQHRPHSRLGYLSPARFAAQLSPSPAPVGLRPPSAGDGQN
jgi:putative transposase